MAQAVTIYDALSKDKQEVVRTAAAQMRVSLLRQMKLLQR